MEHHQGIHFKTQIDMAFHPGGTGIELQRTRFELLVAALVGLGGSLLYDMFYSGTDTGTRVLIEDGLKFLGLVALATWATATAADIERVRSAIYLVLTSPFGATQK